MMLTYSILLLIIIGGMLLIDTLPNCKNKAKKQLVFAGLVITVFWGSVDAVKFSTDILSYYNNAIAAANTSFNNFLNISPFEKGYAAFIWLVTHIFKTPQALLLVQTVIVTFSIFRFIYRNSKDVIISVISYLCLGCFGMFSYAYRQAFAIAICLFALEAIQKKKRILAIIIILFASLFHQTAIIFLPVLLIYGKKLNQKNILLFSGIMILVALTLSYTLPYANEFFEMNYGSSTNKYSTIGGIINLFIFALSFILLWAKYRHTPKNFRETEFNNLHIFVFLGIIGFVLYTCRFYALAMERVAYYFLPAFCILFADGLTTHTKKRLPDLFMLFLILACGLFLYRSIDSLSTYHFVWW